MHADPSHLSLQGVALATSLEPSHVQYLLTEFHELFAGSATGLPSDPRDFELLRELHRQFFVLGKPTELIRAESSRRGRCRIWAITSGKGGVGKTTFSVNLAVALAERGLRVLLFDADFGMANAHVYAGVTPQATLLDVVEGRASLAQIVTPGPAGVQMVCGASGVARLADLGPAARDALLRELQRIAPVYDVLLLDTGAGIAAAVLQLVAVAHEMVVITTPNLAATLDAYGVIKAAHEARVPASVRVLVNEADDEAMAGAVFGRIKGCAERFLGITPQMLGWLPADPAFEAANRQRRPLLLANPDHPCGQRVRDLAGRLCQDIAGAASRTSPATAAA